MNNSELEKIYQRRFNADIVFRNKMWKLLCRNFFQKYIPTDSVVLEVAAGYCEFINNIVGKRKIVLDLNSDIRKFAANGVEVISSDSTNMTQIGDNSCDIIFVSNFFEHLNKEDIARTIKEAYRILKKNGKILVLQPNIRFCYKDYWNFFDHVTPLDDRSLAEALEINGFKVIKCLPKFLPYSTKSKLPKYIFLIKLYLKLPFLQYILGKQAFIVARK